MNVTNITIKEYLTPKILIDDYMSVKVKIKEYINLDKFKIHDYLIKAVKIEDSRTNG